MVNYRMKRQPDLPTDLFVTVLPQHNNEIVWEQVYQKYAPMIYGIILNLTGHQRIASEIFKEAFLDLKRKRIFSRAHIALCQTLLRHAYKLTMKYLDLKGMKPINVRPFHGNFKMLNLLYFDLISTKDAAVKLNISEQEVLVKLRMEFNQLRRQPIERPIVWTTQEVALSVG